MIRDFVDSFRISCGFPLFVFQPLKPWHALHLRPERYRSPPHSTTISSVRPQTLLLSGRRRRSVYLHIDKR